MKKANDYLQTQFIPSYWNKNNRVLPQNTCSEFSPLPGHYDLDAIFSIKEYRKIRNDHTFSYGNTFYLIESPIRSSIAKQEIEVRTGLDGYFYAWFAGRQLAISEVIEPKKPAFSDPEIERKIAPILLAEQLKNVTEAARICGVSRQTIYKNKKLLEEKGPQALKRTFNPEHHRKNRASPELEEIVIQFSLKNPHLGQAEVSRQLFAQYQIEISPSGIRYIWLREEMNTMALRLQKINTTADVA